MKILLVSATEKEINPVLKFFNAKQEGKNLSCFRAGKNTVDALVTAPGIANTSFWLGKILAKKKYDLAINAGIAGSFRRNIPLGAVVNVVSDCLADFGAEDGSNFLTAEEMGLVSSSGFRVQGSKFNNKILSSLSKVKGITVNTVHGNDASIKKAVKKFNPDVESMEGAAFFLACAAEKIPCVQVRAVSNYVERRNKKSWKLKLAFQSLTTVIQKLTPGI